MGQQQLLFIVIGILIVALAIVLGIYMYNSWSISSNKDAMLNDLYNISAQAYGYFMRMKMLGGGGGSYFGLILPSYLQSNSNGDYSYEIASDGLSINFIATSRYGFGTITARLDEVGNLTNIKYTGAFQY